MNEATQKVLSRIKAVRGTIECAWNAAELEVELTDKVYAKTIKPVEFISRNVFLAVMADVLNVAQSPDFKSIITALHEDPTAADEFSRELALLKIDVRSFQEYYIHYVDCIETFDAVAEARETLFSLLEGVYTSGDVNDARKLYNAICQFVGTNTILADDVYRDDFVGKTMELPSFDSDEQMTWPEPCESELTGPLPSPRERLNDELAWLNWPTDVTRFVAHTENEVGHVFMKDLVSRLWGKSSRLVGGTEVSNKIRVQMPRWVMYPFYDELFNLTCNISRAVSDYREGVLGTITGSSAIKRFGPPALSASIKNPYDGIHLPWFMEKLLLFAPREYFTPQCNHYAYMMLGFGLFNQTLDELCKAFPNFDTRDVARDTRSIHDGIRVFQAAFQQTPKCTRREYMARVQDIMTPIKEALNRLSDDLYALECEMEKVRPEPKKVRKGCKHDTYAVEVTKAAELTGIPAVTLYRILKKPKNTLAMVLDHSAEAVIAWGESYKKGRAARKAAKHEVREMNHAKPISSLSVKTRRKTGV